MTSPVDFGTNPDLSTVDPNPDVYTMGSQSTADQISQVGNVLGQWGSVIAGIVSGQPTVVQTSTGTQISTGSAANITRGPNSILLLIVIAVVIVLVLRSGK